MRAPSCVFVEANSAISDGLHCEFGSWYKWNCSYGQWHVPMWCSHGTLPTIFMAWPTACRTSRPAGMESLVFQLGHGMRRSTTPRPQVGHGLRGSSMTAICRQGAPSRGGWYPVEVGSMGHTRSKGSGADTAERADPAERAEPSERADSAEDCLGGGCKLLPPSCGADCVRNGISSSLSREGGGGCLSGGFN